MPQKGKKDAVEGYRVMEEYAVVAVGAIMAVGDIVAIRAKEFSYECLKFTHIAACTHVVIQWPVAFTIPAIYDLHCFSIVLISLLDVMIWTSVSTLI